MKKILSLTILAIAVLGCKKDFLDRVPTTSTVIESYYNTPADGTKAVTAIYNMLLRDDTWSPILLSEIASDDCAGGGGTGDGGGYQRYDRGIQQPEANTNQDAWTTYYGGIYRANIYLKNESKINWTGKETLQKQYIAEARFLRGYFHFLLARMFGEIPYIDHPLASDETPGRTAAASLYGSILSDFKYCAENGLSDKYGAMTSANWGRATKWAADAMIARVYLFYSGYYNQSSLTVDGASFTATSAQTYIDDAITNSGHDLVSKFASLWRVPCYSQLGIAQYAGEINSEVVWSIRYDITGNSNQSYGAGWWQRIVGPRGTNIDPYGQGWGGMPVLPSLWAAYDASDPRRGATILSWSAESKTYEYKKQQQAQYTGYNTKKYEYASVGGQTEDIALGGTNWQFDGFEDYMVIRFADVLLMGAELHLGDGKDLIYINRVRQRAFGDATHNLASVALTDIQNERKLELACEGIRYWDILRYCKGDFTKLKTVLTYTDSNDGGDYSNTADMTSLDVDGSKFVSTKGLFQIPANEIDLMKGAMEQNPGYN